MSREKKTKKNKGPIVKTIVKDDVSYEDKVPAWMFDKVDKSGKFAFDINRQDFNHQKFLDKIVSYSSMTWAELKIQTHDNGKSKHHFLSVDDLSKDAQKRIEAMHLDEDTDRLYSIALENKLRIIGLRERDRFHVLWYDPQHDVCPSVKKHT